MKTELNDFEKGMLNKIIPTRTLEDSKGVLIALRNFIGDEREQIMIDNELQNEREFRELQSKSVKNIYQYLLDHDYLGERDGGVHFLTEKGKNLRRQGSLEAYDAWQKETRAKNKVIIHTIETKGYLDQDEIIRNRRRLMMKRIKRIIVYPLLVIGLLFVALVAMHHYKLDSNIPLIKNLFKDSDEAAANDAKDQGDHRQKGHRGKKGHK